MAHIRKILVPVDGSGPSTAALDEAVTLAEDLGASVEVLEVNAPDAFVVGSATQAAAGPRERATRDRDEAVSRARARLADRMTRRTVSGDPLHSILEIAAEEAVDLVVMGTHGRVGRLETLIGSLAVGVIRSSPCPVLTVRQTEGAEESFSERVHGRPTLADQSRNPR